MAWASPTGSPSAWKSRRAVVVLFRASVAALLLAWMPESAIQAVASPALSCISWKIVTDSLATFTASRGPRVCAISSEIESSIIASSSFQPEAWYCMRCSCRAFRASVVSPMSRLMSKDICSMSTSSRTSVSSWSMAWALATQSSASRWRFAAMWTSATSCCDHAATFLSPDLLSPRSSTAPSAVVSASSPLSSASCRLTTFWNAASSRLGSFESLASTLSLSIRARASSCPCGAAALLPWIWTIVSSTSAMHLRSPSSLARVSAVSIASRASSGFPCIWYAPATRCQAWTSPTGSPTSSKSCTASVPAPSIMSGSSRASSSTVATCTSALPCPLLELVFLAMSTALSANAYACW
mmetsp:Transcript_51041/g.131586  ORF Transcript_51041/g.131586 Transcript_51041/m.131586 type:complete len:355 (-) Transcript_51041:744-1808(-)